ncbi:uncharacterized protein LY79DRAFT_641967 [Colletotrichum navitas]|uniref:PRISE-like Rossmann-fold domain-containing protein n=1 Tax=Colletotrichum navitas TaxID=681940 RepID=A0AAD8PNX7_9PEZI|nr:uncharacterized protein LY79DRAFT_641967 [Colletotrichum navitas]KAK1573004.1 hypothetical protein LY79DRAFT_641967 [Colletotrichum navitas]
MSESGDTTILVSNNRIYRGLPVYGSVHKGYVALVVGANGLTGTHMARVLGASPGRWEKVYCLSRSHASADFPSNVDFIQSDLLSGTEELGRTLRDLNGNIDYVFFFAYTQPPPSNGGRLWSNVDEMVSSNRALLVNLLSALDYANIKPRRFLLQTGGKNYGVHLGPTKTPQEEWFPRCDLEPNFYYFQEDSLWDWCRKNATEWVISMPSFVIGAVPHCQMSLALPLGIYAAVSAYLGEPLVFLGDISAWTTVQRNSSAMLNAYFAEWLALEEKTANEKFNSTDGTIWTWEMMFPRIADWYGIKVEGPRPDDSPDYITVPARDRLPPRGYKSSTRPRFRSMTTSWAKQSKVQTAWNKLKEDHGLKNGAMDNIESTFAILDGAMIFPSSGVMSTDKARKRGWNGYVDSYESLLETLDELAELKLIPPVPKVKVQFM